MMKNKSFVFLGAMYIFLAIGLLLFSYTQVDLGLTLSQQSFVQTIQKLFQYVGFYRRPWATGCFSGLTILMTLLYPFAVYRVLPKLKRTHFWGLVGVMSGILLFSYPAALSYDIYNYVFTAKTVVIYQKNPYTLIPLQLSGIDSMLSFMRWTHLPSAYTPIWIFSTVPVYFLSFGNLLLSLFLLKGFVISWYIVSIWAIGKIVKKIQPQYELSSMAAFAFHPLVITEVLISAHNDVMMMAFALVAMVFALEKKRFSSFFFLSLSVSVKLMTIFLAPLVITGWKRKTSLVCMAIGLLLVLLRREFLPWYFLWIIPFLSLYSEYAPVTVLSAGIGVGLILRYLPVLYTGGYDSPVSTFQQIFFWGAISITLAIDGVLLLFRKRFSSNGSSRKNFV